MALTARDCWASSSSVFTVHERHAPCLPIVFEKPVRYDAPGSIDASPVAAGELESSVADLMQIKLDSEVESIFVVNEDGKLSMDVDVDTTSCGGGSGDDGQLTPTRMGTRTGTRSTTKKVRKFPSARPSRKAQTSRGHPLAKRKPRKPLSLFEELMLKLNAVDGPQLVLQLTKLEDMRPADIAVNW